MKYPGYRISGMAQKVMILVTHDLCEPARSSSTVPLVFLFFLGARYHTLRPAACTSIAHDLFLQHSRQVRDLRANCTALTAPICDSTSPTIREVSPSCRTGLGSLPGMARVEPRRPTRWRSRRGSIQSRRSCGEKGRDSTLREVEPRRGGSPEEQSSFFRCSSIRAYRLQRGAQG